MLDEPKKHISKKALTVWRVIGGIETFFTLIISTVLIILSLKFNWSVWVIVVAVSLTLISLFVFTLLIPTLRWKRWRYDVREQEVELQQGVWIVKRTLVPMIRVQHVDTVQGPLLRAYGLATIKISTAATVHEIPALELDEAEELRQLISKLARVADEDV